MKSNTKRVIMAILVLLSMLALVACGSGAAAEAPADTSTATQDKSFQTVIDNGELKVGMCPEYPPFSTVTTDGKIEGYDADYASAIAQNLGVKANISNTPWESLIAQLNKGAYDVVISCISPAEAEQAGELVSFSKPYYTLKEIIITRADNDDIKTKEDLIGKIVGVQDNCSSSLAADTLPSQGIEVEELNKYERNAGAIADLNNGRLDAVIVGEAYAATQVKNNADFKIVNDAVSSVDVVVVLKKDAVELKTAIDKAIDEYLVSDACKANQAKWLAY